MGRGGSWRGVKSETFRAETSLQTEGLRSGDCGAEILSRLDPAKLSSDVDDNVDVDPALARSTTSEFCSIIGSKELRMVSEMTSPSVEHEPRDKSLFSSDVNDGTGVGIDEGIDGVSDLGVSI